MSKIFKCLNCNGSISLISILRPNVPLGPSTPIHDSGYKSVFKIILLITLNFLGGATSCHIYYIIVSVLSHG